MTQTQPCSFASLVDMVNDHYVKPNDEGLLGLTWRVSIRGLVDAGLFVATATETVGFGFFTVLTTTTTCYSTRLFNWSKERTWLGAEGVKNAAFGIFGYGNVTNQSKPEGKIEDETGVNSNTKTPTEQPKPITNQSKPENKIENRKDEPIPVIYLSKKLLSQMSKTLSSNALSVPSALPTA